jgi:serine/threonine protein kinase/tetratricopeptide (TPR) repeat protein
MGEVYRARDPRLGRTVAIKVVPRAFSADLDRLRRFEQEARAAAALTHPNVVAVHDFGTHDGQPYIVSELLEGQTLRRTAAAGPLSAQKVLEYGIQMCRGLTAAHDAGIVHRDLKPENLFITHDGRLKILDFGLAKLTEGRQFEGAPPASGTGTAMTTPHAIVGTVGYMSPEQVGGRPVDARSDLFSAGAVLYELCSGRRAFPGNDAIEILSAILKEEPESLPDTNVLSAGLNRLILRCLEKSPLDRFQSARDLAFTLDTLLSITGSPSGTRPVRPRVSSAAPSGPFRLIVLPFDLANPRPDDAWLATAFADSLTFGLRHAENLIIVHREQSDATTEVRQLADTLDVRYCVKGTVQRIGEDLRVVARLIDTANGAITLQESVTDRFSNLLAIEEMLAGRFVSAFEAPRAGPVPNRTASLSAYKRVVLASELHRTGRYREAAHYLELVAAQDADYADAWALLANSYARMTSPAASDDGARHEFQRKALNAARKAADLEPSLYEAHIALALAYRGLEDIERWRMSSLKAIELNPRLAEAYVLLGQSYFASPLWGFARLRDADLARHYLERALLLDPRFGLGHNALVYHLTWDGRPAEALVAADAALALLPDHIDILRARAMALLRLNQVDETEQILLRLSSESVGSAQDEWGRAAIDLLRGDRGQAAGRFEAVIARGPRAMRALDTALVYCQAGLFPAAAGYLATARAAAPSCALFASQSPSFAAYRDQPAIAAILTAEGIERA